MNHYIITAAVSYLLGSIPFGYLLVWIFTGEDVRTSGSGNIGATNVARKSPLLGILTLVLDALKGLAAVLVARGLFGAERPQIVMTVAAFFAVLGHLFPIWLKFRGGKGVATSLGAFILLTPKSILCMVVLFLMLGVLSDPNGGGVATLATDAGQLDAFVEAAGPLRPWLPLRRATGTS